MARVEFFEMDDGSASWATFEVRRIYQYGSDGVIERLWARPYLDDRNRPMVAFGREYDAYGEGAKASPPIMVAERRIALAVLERVVAGGNAQPGDGRFIENDGTSVVYRTPCGERRRVRITDLRAVVNDMQGLFEQMEERSKQGALSSV